jgi:hypothetical protein
MISATGAWAAMFADVAYRPGVDAYGRKVVPADAGGRVLLKLPDLFEFNIDVDIRKYLGGPEDDAAAATSPFDKTLDATADTVEASLATAATAADTAATSASTSTSDFATANTALIAAKRKAQKFAALNMTVGKVRYNIKTGP